MTKETIRRARPSDADLLAELSRETFAAAFADLYPAADLEAFLAGAYRVDETRRLLADPRVGAWLLHVGETAVGYALAGPCTLPNPAVTTVCGELKRLYLLPDWQGGGRGSRLLAAALAWLERDGPRAIWIGVFSGNRGAQRLYERHGFTKVGEHEFLVGAQRDREFTYRRG